MPWAIFYFWSFGTKPRASVSNGFLDNDECDAIVGMTFNFVNN